jgi:uncharacterized OB-fold protein
MSEEKKAIPFHEGMWITGSDGKVKLLGSKCPSCSEVFFPRKINSVCTNCQHEGLENVELSDEGRIKCYTSSMQAPAGGYYHGPVPYHFGLIDLDDGVRVESHIGGVFESLKVGMRVKLAIFTLYTDEGGNQIQAYQFRPADEN